MVSARVIQAGQLDYQVAWDFQRKIHQERVAGRCPDTLVLTEHPHTYTIGKSGDGSNLVTDENELKQQGITVYRIDRGGDITYHGPGQIIGYPILDLHDYYLDIHRFLRELEEVIILTLADYGITAGRVKGLTGVWVENAKVAAIGIKVSRWVTMHGFAFNLNTDLKYFGHIVPCGITDRPVTSMQLLLGRKLDISEVSEKLVDNFGKVFGIRFQEQRLTNLTAGADEVRALSS